MAAASDPHLTPSRQVAVREDWLAQVREEIIDPALPIIDPHHHLWDGAVQIRVTPKTRNPFTIKALSISGA